MAVLQRQFPRTFERPAAPSFPKIKLPVPPQRVRAYRRESEKACRKSIVFFMTTASILVLYIAGHASMTAVNYQRIKILAQTRGLNEQIQTLRTSIIQKSDRRAVEDWAKAHGLVPDTRAAVVLPD